MRRYSYAEFAVAPARQCLPVPAGTTLVDAAGLPEAYCTVWPNLFGLGRLARGDSLLVHGGTSGIGVTAIQLGAAFGARVLATAGSDEKCDACRALGAEVAINYRREDFVEVARTATQGRGVDVILDVVGAEYATRNVSALARGGRLIVVGLMSGARAEVDLLALLLKGAILTGSALRPKPNEEKAAICAELEEQVWPLFASGRLKPMTFRIFSLEEASTAHNVLEASEHIGKVLLAP